MPTFFKKTFGFNFLPYMCKLFSRIDIFLFQIFLQKLYDYIF
jgi:hypothetical protein